MIYNIRKAQEKVIYDAIKNERDDKTAQKLVFGDTPDSLHEDDASWVKNTMKRLEETFDPASLKNIRMNCQCGYAMDEKLALLKELIETSSNLEEFANQDKAVAAGLSYEKGEIFLQFQYCPCPMLSNVNHLDTNTWCLCTTGYSKILFEKAFACQVDVELLKSIKMGNDICLMKIKLLDFNWK